jgi:hypothetical protein
MRFMMGIAVISILVPALAVTVPGGIGSLVPWFGNGYESQPLFATEPANTTAESLAAVGDSLSADTPQTSLERPARGRPPPALEIELITTSTDPTNTTDSSAQGSSSTLAGSGSSTSSSGTGGGNPPIAPPAGATITGDACPCMVHGTTELKGNISLHGDIMVMGGTLVARPGVNLNGNGYQIMFMDGGQADFQGTKAFTWSGNGSNANLSRDINFRNLRRIMFHQGAGQSTLRYFTVEDSGTAALGDYSIHFHLNGNSTRGTLVEGVVVIGSKNHAYVPHGSHGITFRDTIARNGKCEAYWWDPPEFQSTSLVNNSNDILYDHALADGVTNCPGDNRGFRLSAFELGAGIGNTIRNSVARGVTPTHNADCAGFHWPELNNKQPSSWTFTNNASYGSKCNGIFVWQNDDEDHIVNGFSGDDGIDHGAYVNRYDYRNINVPYVEVHALGWSVTGGSIERVTIFKHNLAGNPVTFSHVSIGSLTVNNGADGGSLPGTYVLDDTDLSCDEITYQSVVPGTRVVIDGSDC